MNPGIRLLRLAVIFGTFYVLVVAAFTILQRSLLYHPWVEPAETLAEAAIARGAVPWQHPDGRLIGWTIPGRPDGTPFLILHGNGGHALHRAFMARCFAAQSGVGHVHILEYPGYGSRPGPFGEAAFRSAAREALLQIGRETGRAPVLVGESLGSAVAGMTAVDLPDATSGLILITPMHSLREVARHHFPFLPTGLILRERYDNAGLAAYSKAVALIAAGNDEVVPSQQAVKLESILPGPKRLWVVKEATHNSLDYSPGHPLWGEVCRFVLTGE